MYRKQKRSSFRTMMNSSQQIENGQEESPPPALEHDTQASLRRRISHSESHRIFVTPSTQPATARSRRTRSTVNHDIHSPIVMDLPLVEAVHATTNSNRMFPTRRSNRIANNRAPGTDFGNSSIQRITPSSSIRTRRARN